MRLFTRLVFVVLVSLAVVSSASHVAAQRQVMTTITRLYTGADGQSHAEDTEVAWRPAKLRPELNESESVKVTAAQFLRWPRDALGAARARALISGADGVSTHERRRSLPTSAREKR
jgi:hypothetical protein